MQQVPEPGSTPLPRIGDAERDAAASRLQAAMAEGRLTTDEFNERLDVALRARTEADLAPLFADLPSPATNPQAVSVSPAASARVPDASEHSGDAPVRSGSRWYGMYGAVWPVTLIVLFATHWRWWWLIFIPMVMGPLVFGRARSEGQQAQQRRDQHLQDRMDRRLDRMDRRAQRFEQRTARRLQHREEQRQVRG